MSDLVAGYVLHLRAIPRSEETIVDRRRLLLRIDRELIRGLAGATAGHIEAWLARYAAHSRWTSYTYHVALASFYRWACRGRYARLPHNPMDELTHPAAPECVPRPATEDQVATALARLVGQWRLAVLLAAFDGLRCAEIAGLDREQVSADWLPVRRKGGRLAYLPTHPLVWETVRTLPPGPLLRTAAGRGFLPDYLSRSVSLQLDHAGLPDLTLHRFRHRFATAALDAGATIRTVQELLGHKWVSSTQIYTQVTDRQRRRAIETLPVPTTPTPQQETA